VQPSRVKKKTSPSDLAHILYNVRCVLFSCTYLPTSYYRIALLLQPNAYYAVRAYVYRVWCIHYYVIYAAIIHVRCIRDSELYIMPRKSKTIRILYDYTCTASYIACTAGRRRHLATTKVASQFRFQCGLCLRVCPGITNISQCSCHTSAIEYGQ